MRNTLLLSLFILLIACQPKPDFVELKEYVPGVLIDLRYAGNDNFVGKPIDGYQNKKCLMSREAANALKGAQQEARKMGYSIKVFDAYRPQRAVDHFVRWAKNLNDTLNKQKYYPKVKKSMLFEQDYIAAKSGHSRGSAIDLTLVDQSGKELDMGTGWDYFGSVSWPTSNEVSKQQQENRMTLQTLMKNNGFMPIKTEWWHFYLKNEPYPDTYFDFVP
jgi:D-alanyl-D-alanine dipeptidase